MKNKFDLIFITTFIDNKNISNLLSSIIESNNALHLLIILVNQGDVELDKYKSNPYIKFIEITILKTSLSNARNVGIEKLINNKIEFDFIMFPDDDTTFDKRFFDDFKKFTQPNQNYLINVIGTGTNKFYKKIKLPENQLILPSKYIYAMSVNMIICKDSLLNTHGFDENLGVGTINGSGEDQDFFIRVSQHKLFTYKPNLYNYHPLNLNKINKLSHSKIKDRYKGYSRGYVYFIKKHSLRKDFFKSHFRTLAISVYYLLLFKPRMTLLYLELFVYRIQLMYKK